MKALPSTNVADVEASMCPGVYEVIFFVGKEFPQECFSEQSTGNDESREFNDASFVASGDDSEPFHMVLR